jgi:steroid delta-isomerase-like uncharacterized protein
MKKILFTLLVCVSLFACTNESAKREKIESENVKFYTNVWEVAINEGRINILDTAYAANVVLHTVPETKGKDAAKAHYANFVTGFSDRQFIVKSMFAKGDQLVKHWVFKGKHTGNFFGIPATGKTVNLEGCTIAKIVDGKITEEQDFFDNLEFLQQLGLMPRS